MSQDPFRVQTQFSVFPPVIKNLLIINGLVFLATMPGGPLSDLIYRWFALWPASATGYFWPWQLVSYGFVHADFYHILFNMFALWMFGIQIENLWGSRRFTLFYFICVIGAALFQLVVSFGQFYPTVGASGGVYGVLLAYGMLFPNQIIYLYFAIPVKAKWVVIGMGVFALFSGITGTQSGTAHFAHLGGMVFGILLILFWRGKLPIKPSRRNRIY